MKRIAALLTVHNRREKTLQCLQKVFEQEHIDDFVLDVYLTDDGCTDGTPEAIRERFPQVHIIQGDGNLYWNRGMYVAWEEATKENYEYYLWLNDDTFVYPQMIKTLIESSSLKNDGTIIVGSTQDKAHTKLTYGGRIKGRIPQPDGALQQVDYFNGNIVLVPRRVYQVVGNLDWHFTHSKGDFDYGLRAKKAGIKVFQVGTVLGECDAHERIDKWCDPEVPFRLRWKTMWKPNGMPPHETYHLERRHYGILPAMFHYLTIILRCCLPQLWKAKK